MAIEETPLKLFSDLKGKDYNSDTQTLKHTLVTYLICTSLPACPSSLNQKGRNFTQ
jgi:hypothetical protein